MSAYASGLANEFGISLNRFREVLGNPGGVHSDPMLLMCRMISLPIVENVIEFGSGLSTLVFASVCERTNTQLYTFEDWPHWAAVANKALGQLGTEHRVIDTKCQPSNCPDFGDKKFQVAWVDGNVFYRRSLNPEPGKYVESPVDLPRSYTGREGACRYYQSNLQEALLVFDDAEVYPPYKKIVEEFGRDQADVIWYAPTGRPNRQQVISLPKNVEPVYREVIQDTINLYKG